MKTLALFETFLRSFFLQTLWNFERMQNMGFAFSVAPLLRLAHSSKKAYTNALRRHTAFFNTHPYLASTVMGIVYFREKDRSPEAVEDATLTNWKESMGGAFGAIGDHVIWGTWRPFCALMALGVGLLVAYPTVGGESPSIFDRSSAAVCAKWWVAGFLCAFNSVHLWLRWRGLQKGAADGPGAVRWVQSLNLQAWAAQVRRVGLGLLLVMMVVYLMRWKSADILIWMMAIFLGAVILKRWGASSFLIFYLVCGACIAMTKLGIQWL